MNKTSKRDSIPIDSSCWEVWARRKLARKELIEFAQYTNRTYKANWHHEAYAEKLDGFISGKTKKLMVFMPPQHGKSELCSRRLPAKILGDNPDKRIAVVSYNHNFASKFNRDVQRIIDSPEYRELYPGTNLNVKNIRTVTGAWLRNADEFEAAGRKGGLVSVGTGGGLTGRAVDILIIDDPYKDHMEAWSPTVRARVQDWYDTVANTRLHNESQQLITLTRWHPDDLAGTLLKRSQADWEVVVFPAIKEGEPNEYDKRADGEALWEERHSLKRLLEIKENNSHVFQSLYQQDPKPAEGLLFPAESLKRFKLADIKSRKPDGIIAIADVADTGKDYYCMLIAYLFGKNIYVADCIFTQSPTEITEPLTLGMLNKHKIQTFRVESNNGGRLFAKSIREKCGGRTIIKDIPTTANKETRIFTASYQIKEFIHFLDKDDMPPKSDYQKFFEQLTSYSMQGKNEHDDAADGCTMLIDMTENMFDYRALL
jgi:predicted phage terminase large subunit-like protein